MAGILTYLALFITITSSVTSHPADTLSWKHRKGGGRRMHIHPGRRRQYSEGDQFFEAPLEDFTTQRTMTHGDTRETLSTAEYMSQVTHEGESGSTNIMRIIKASLMTSDFQNSFEMSNPITRNVETFLTNYEHGRTNSLRLRSDTVVKPGSTNPPLSSANPTGDFMEDGMRNVLPPISRQKPDCSPEMCEDVLNRRNIDISLRKRPSPVPLKSKNWQQIEKSRHVIVQYNNQLRDPTIPEGALPSLPSNQTIVNLTGEEDGEVMQNFGSFFHNFEEVPTDHNFHSEPTRHRTKRNGGHVYVCSHQREWGQLMLAFSAENKLVQLYQTPDLQQYVLTNRCTEPRSSVVPHVICVNEISTVNVIVLNLETGVIEPAFINVESCRAKYVE